MPAGHLRIPPPLLQWVGCRKCGSAVQGQQLVEGLLHQPHRPSGVRPHACARQIVELFPTLGGAPDIAHGALGVQARAVDHHGRFGDARLVQHRLGLFFVLRISDAAPTGFFGHVFEGCPAKAQLRTGQFDGQLRKQRSLVTDLVPVLGVVIALNGVAHAKHAVIGNEGLPDHQGIRPCGAHAGHVPGVFDGNIFHGDQREAIIKLVALRVHERNPQHRPVGVVTAAGEGPLSGDFITAGDFFGRRPGRKNATDPRVGILAPDVALRPVGVKARQPRANRNDEKDPTGRTAAHSERCRDFHLRRERHLMSAETPRRLGLPKTRIVQGFDGGFRYPALRVGLGHVFSQQWSQGKGCIDQFLLRNARGAGFNETHASIHEQGNARLPQPATAGISPAP